MVEALDIHVQGIVQGVGFRPFVYRMAKKYLISGWVLNAADGVYVHAEGESKLLDEFVLELSDNAPAAAQVKQIELKEVPLEGFDGFEIRFSNEGAVEQTTLVSPELATCDDCLREMGNPNDRRFHYPFVNCTNCGPRFTIIEELPYDRKSTSMREFEMCDRCAAEYADPLDRRFHAQPDACFECGPVVSFVCSDGAGGFTGATVRYGTTLEESDAIFAEAAEMLAQGKIVAVKGLGGYHLVCDARNAQAVATLRERKRREGKAFAVMMSDVVAVREVCEVNEVEESLLSGAQRPIVLLKKRSDAVLAPRLADGLSELGVMLPYTPVQHLLLDAFAKALASGAARQASSLEGAARQALSSAASLSQDVALRAAASDASLPSVASNDNVSHETFVPLEGAEGADYGDAARADASAGCDAQGNAALSDSAQAGDSQGASWATFSPDGDVSRETSVPVCVVSAHGEVVAGDSLAGAFAHCEPWSIGAPMLVMTSGNIHDEPIAIGNEEAQEKLAEVADAFLGNNRAILTRFDDSVVRVVKAGSAGYALQFVRRARGYAPSPLPLALTQRAEGPSVIFATGPEQKNTFTLLRTNAHVNASADADAGSDISEPGRADVSSEAGMVSSNRPTATAPQPRL